MKRISILTGLMLGLTIGALGLLYTHAPASAGGDLEYKCYKERISGSSTRELKQIYLSDQFEEKNVIVRTPVMYCSPIIEGRYSNPLLCYSIKDAPGQPRFRPEEIETNDRFHSLDVIVTQPYALCETSKQVGVSAGGVNEQNFTVPRMKCYKVRRAEHSRLDSESVFMRDKFGGKTGKVTSPVLFCTEVFEKKHSAKNDDFNHVREIGDVPFEDHVSTLTSTHPRTDPTSECGDYAHSVWYQYTPSGKETAYISTVDSTYPTLIAVFQGQGKGDLEEVACESLFSAPGLEVNLKPGVTYWILVGSAPRGLGGKLKFSFDVEATCASNCPDPDPDPDAEAAGQATPPRPRPPQISDNDMMCYSISQQGPGVFVGLENQFGSYELALGRATLFCTEADKCRLVDSVSASGAVGDIVEVAGC